MDNDGSNPIRLTDSIGLDWKPIWSPDGTKIAFQSQRDGDLEIYISNLPDTTHISQLTDNAFGDSNPKWSPDGTKILFRSKRDGNEEIYTMNADGTNQTNVSNHASKDLSLIHI